MQNEDDAGPRAGSELPSDPNFDEQFADDLAVDEAIGSADHQVGLVNLEPSASPERRPARVDFDEADPQTRRAVRKRARADRKTSRGKTPWWELPVLIIIAVVVAMLIKTFLVQPYYIPSASMEQTLHGCPGCSGDKILVNKPIYDIRSPHPGDIVVFRAPAGWDDDPLPAPPKNPILKGIRWVGQLIGFVPPDENDLVKRVIAVGGQTVQCCDAQGRLQVSNDGPKGPFHSLDEPYVYENWPWVPADRPGQPIAPGDLRTFGPVTIPNGRLWVMGDHRSVSEDSFWHYTHNFRGDVVASTAPVSSVIGKAVLIVWPPSRWRTLGTPSTFKQLALGVGGSVAPTLGAFAVVLPVGLLRRRRRRPRRPAAGGPHAPPSPQKGDAG